jgi:HEAT repeat protein
MKTSNRYLTGRGALALLLVAAFVSTAASQDPIAGIRSESAAERVRAVRHLGEGNAPEANALLVEALADRDWEVVHEATIALRRKYSPAALQPLVELSLQGPIRRIRLSAAATLGLVAPAESAKYLQPAMGAKGIVPALAAEALAEIRHASSIDGLRQALRSKEGTVRREAAAALGSMREPQYLKDLEPLFADPDFGVRAGAIEGMARIGSFDALPYLISGLQAEDPSGAVLSDIIERRLAHAIRRILNDKRTDPDIERAVQRVVGAFRNEKNSLIAARLARVLGSIGRREPPPPPPPAGTEPEVPKETVSTPQPTKPEVAKGNPPAQAEGVGPVMQPDKVIAALVEVGMAHSGPEARRASAAALGRCGGDVAIAALQKAVVEDKDPRVRFHAIRGVIRWRDARDDASLQMLSKVLQYDDSALVREEAAVHLGLKGLIGAVDTLAARFEKDTAWEVAVASAVSLGKTRDPRAIDFLVKGLTHKDWRYRGAAAAGLGWTDLKEAIPHLMVAVGDEDACVARTAWEFLKRISGKGDIVMKRKAWEDWWTASAARFEVIDREKEIRDAKKYGYAPRDRDVYEDLDVVVLQSRGDSIENLLATLEIKHRLTRAKGLKDSGVQPFGVFVSNCTGEVQKEDHERIQWFVHVGGALFASCWAINETIGIEFPDTIRKYQAAKGQVLDKVRAEEMPTETPYLDGVFPDVTRPMYELYGAYLIEVLDPERCEVLMDSPDCATRWNGGTLAAWFTAGHGVVMGSSNHFDRQTLSKLKDAKNVSIRNEAERMAFAADHFGFDYARIRDLKAKGVFARQADAEKEVTDQSAFRFLTNFVRRKRLGEQ